MRSFLIRNYLKKLVENFKKGWLRPKKVLTQVLEFKTKTLTLIMKI